MATATVQTSGGHGPAFQAVSTAPQQSSTPAPHHVQTTLYYYKEAADGSPPKPRYVGFGPINEADDYSPDPVQWQVTDITGNESKYTLDGQGFQIYKHESKEKDFTDNEKIKAEYYPEVEQLLKDATGASRIFIFDHTIRRPSPDSTPASEERGPVQRVHIDQSYTASKSRVPHHLPDLADQLLQTRYQIINVWRPIKTIYKDPLGVADATSVPDSDLVGVPLIYPNRNGETYAVKWGEGHRWYYKYAQTPAEVTLIKCFDSKVDGRARRVPHSAFVNPEEEAGYGRESIEVRCLVFHEDQSAK